MSGTLSIQRNALGIWLPVSGDIMAFGLATEAGSLFVGSDLNDVIYSYGGAIQLSGGWGDDTYYTWDPTDVVVEAANAGVDTVVSYADRYVLSAQVENLIVASDGASGTGNAMDNIVGGEDGRQTLDGGAGNDVLIGGAGADTFVYARGAGADVIADFQPGLDAVSFNTTLSQFGDFAAVRTAMAQSGADVVLNLGAGDSITFRNHQLTDFAAADFRLAPAVGAMRQTFAEEFTTLRTAATGLDSARKPVWQTAYEFYDGHLSRTLAPGNPETQFYSDTTVGVNPFTATATTVKITAAPATTALPDGLSYTSGILTSRTSFSQTYGYFEMSAKLPEGQGFWPGFWMIRADSVWPPELDIMEASSSQGDVVSSSTLSATGGIVSELSAATYVANSTTLFHTYGVSWRPDMLRFYVDGREMFAAPTPADMNTPMYLVASLAVGSDAPWPGPADGVSSGTMEIDYIRAWQYRDIAPVLPSSSSMRVLIGTAQANTLVGGAGGDRFDSGRGNDKLTGGGGADRFVFADLTGTDTITDFQPGVDKLVIQGFSAAQITTTLIATGMQVAFGSSKVVLSGIWWIGPDDIVAGATVTTGTTGADTLDQSNAGAAEASISGLAGADTLRGGIGDDWITGGAGNDVMTGNGGRDSFVLAAGAGQDTITDFVPGLDRLVLTGISQASLIASWATVGGVEGLRLNYGAAGDSVFLAGVNNALRPDSIFLA